MKEAEREKIVSLVLSYVASLTIGMNYRPEEVVDAVFDVLDANIVAWGCHDDADSQTIRQVVERRIAKLEEDHMLRERRTFLVTSLRLTEFPESYQLEAHLEFQGEKGTDHEAKFPVYLDSRRDEETLGRLLLALRLFEADIEQLREEDANKALKHYVSDCPGITCVMQVKFGGREKIPYRPALAEGIEGEEEGLDKKRVEIGLPTIEEGFAREQQRRKKARRKRLEDEGR